MSTEDIEKENHHPADNCRKYTRKKYRFTQPYMQIQSQLIKTTNLMCSLIAGSLMGTSKCL